MSERVPAWAESDERYPEREAEWRAAIARAERAERMLASLPDCASRAETAELALGGLLARAERAEAGLSRAIDVTNERDGLRFDLAAAIARAERAEAGLAVLREAAADVRVAFYDLSVPHRVAVERHAVLDAALADTAAAAEAYRASVVAPWKAALDAARRELQRTLAEHDTLAAALVEVREAGRGVLEMFDADSDEDPTRADMDASMCALRDALAALPADLAAERDRRVRAGTLESAADAIERGSVLSQYGAHGWLRARAADERGGK